jgi:ketosteroid isomerase-like protein
MYKTIVAAKVRGVWDKVAAGDIDAPARMATEDMTFTFVGDTEMGAQLHTGQEFGEWFRGIHARFPGIRFTVRDVLVRGWPWRTTVAVRIGIAATLADGSHYENEIAQWLELRWGKLTDDWVLEDTLALSRALEVQRTAAAAG